MMYIQFLFIIGISIGAVLSQVQYARPWEKGTNICAYVTRDGLLDYKICTHCLPWKQIYGKEMTDFLYDCCPGFKKTDRFDNKCVEREKTWKLIPGLLRDHKLNDFADLIVDPKKGAGFKDINDSKSSNVYTVFAPYNSKAMMKLDIDYSQYKGESVHPVLFSVVRDRYYLNDFRNGMVLTTEFRKQKLKITKYSNGIICIECRVLVEPDHEARNGVVHYFSGPMIPHDTKDLKRKSIMTLLEEDPNTQKFASSLPFNVRKLLSGTESCNWYTVFAPTNDVWDRVQAQYGDKVGPIAANHVLRRGMYCTAAIIKRIKNFGPTFIDEYLETDCGNKGQRLIRTACGEWSLVTKADIMASNGVVHLINKPLVPMSAMSMKMAINANCLKGNNLWVKALKECDLFINPGSKYAVLIPTDAAFEWWMNYLRFKKYYDRFQTDAEFRCRLIRFHIFKMSDERATTLRALWLQQEGYRTNNKDMLWEVDYFMKMYYGSLLYFHYSPVADLRSYRFEGGSIFYIDRVNMIPEQKIIDILPTRAEFSITTKYTKQTKMDANVFQKKRPLNLYLVVRNGGYNVDLQKQLEAKSIDPTKFLLLHYVPMYLWGGDIGYFENGTRHRFKSGLGVELIFDRETDGTMYIGYDGLPQSKFARVVEWNIYAIDGMIWVLDKGLECPGKLCKMKLLEEEVWKVMSFACWEALRVNSKKKRGKQTLDQFLKSVQGDRCYANYDTPKEEKTTHDE